MRNPLIPRCAIVLAAFALSSTAAAQPVTKPAKPRRLGQIVACADPAVQSYRHMFKSGNDVSQVVVVKAGATNDTARVDEGQYEVKIDKLVDGKYVAWTTLSVDARKDGWKIAPACEAPKPDAKPGNKRKLKLVPKP